MLRYYFVDSDHNEVDFETELFYIRNQLEVMCVLLNFCLSHGVSDAVLDSLDMFARSAFDTVSGLCHSVFVDKPSRQTSAGMTADVPVMNDSKV